MVASSPSSSARKKAEAISGAKQWTAEEYLSTPMAEYAGAETSAVGRPLKKRKASPRAVPRSRIRVTMRFISSTDPCPSLSPMTDGMSRRSTAAPSVKTAVPRW